MMHRPLCETKGAERNCYYYYNYYSLYYFYILPPMHDGGATISTNWYCQARLTAHMSWV